MNQLVDMYGTLKSDMIKKSFGLAHNLTVAMTFLEEVSLKTMVLVQQMSELLVQLLLSSQELCTVSLVSFILLSHHHGYIIHTSPWIHNTHIT